MGTIGAKTGEEAGRESFLLTGLSNIQDEPSTTSGQPFALGALSA